MLGVTVFKTSLPHELYGFWRIRRHKLKQNYSLPMLKITIKLQFISENNFAEVQFFSVNC